LPSVTVLRGVSQRLQIAPPRSSRSVTRIQAIDNCDKYLVLSLEHYFDILCAMAVTSATPTKVADEVWLTVALLHREHPDRADFSIQEIMQRATEEAGSRPLRPGIYVHVVQQCVANRPPSPGRYRMLFETAPGCRRLFRSGDAYDPGREGAKTAPAREEIPSEYGDLLDWYRHWNEDNVEDRIKNDPLLALRGSGKALWADEHADEYVRRLREGWE